MFAGEEVQPEQPKEAPKKRNQSVSRTVVSVRTIVAIVMTATTVAIVTSAVIIVPRTTKVVNNARTTVATVARSNSRTLKIVRFASRRAMSPRRANSVTSSNLAASVTVVVTTRNASPAGSQNLNREAPVEQQDTEQEERTQVMPRRKQRQLTQSACGCCSGGRKRRYRG